MSIRNKGKKNPPNITFALNQEITLHMKNQLETLNQKLDQDQQNMPSKQYLARIIILEEDPLGIGDNSNPRHRVHLGVDKNRIRYQFK